MKDKYIEYRVNKIEVQRRKQFGEWEMLGSMEGKGVIASKSLMGLLSLIRRWFKGVLTE